LPTRPSQPGSADTLCKAGRHVAHTRRGLARGPEAAAGRLRRRLAAQLRRHLAADFFSPIPRRRPKDHGEKVRLHQVLCAAALDVPVLCRRQFLLGVSQYTFAKTRGAGIHRAIGVPCRQWRSTLSIHEDARTAKPRAQTKLIPWCPRRYNVGILASVLVHPGFVEQLHHPDASRKGIITAIYYLGTWISYIFISRAASDNLGRRFAALAGIVVTSFGTALQAGASGDGAFAMVVAGRIISGVGIGIVSTSVPLYQRYTRPSFRLCAGSWQVERATDSRQRNISCQGEGQVRSHEPHRLCCRPCFRLLVRPTYRVPATTCAGADTVTGSATPSPSGRVPRVNTWAGVFL